MYLLDTNTLIYFFKGKGNVAEHLFAYAPGEIAVPAVTVYELEVGISKSVSPEKRTAQLAEFLELVKVVDFSSAEARAAAKIRAMLEKAGTPIGPMDTLIAGSAVANDATLVTHNTKEFRRVAGLKLLDWY